MDAYLSKPVQFEELREVVMGLRPASAEKEQAISPETLDALRELGGDGDSDVLTDLIDTFINNSIQIVAEAEGALSNGQGRRWRWLRIR